ncbi:MAG: anti-sigma factor [Limibacillus sp.]|jgi:anti-sigma-K factor RskA
MSDTPEDDWDELAALYALGTLEGEDRQRFEALLQESGEARALLAAWEDRLLTTLGEPEEVPAPPTLWARIQPQVREHDLPLAEEPLSAVDAALQALTTQLTARVRRWRLATAAMATATAALVIYIVLGLPGMEREREIVYVAVLQGEQAQPSLLIDASLNRAMVRPLTPITVPRDRSLELWAITSETGAPRSLGLLDGRGSAEIPLPPNLQGRTGLTLAVSMEPKGGSKTGLPSGPVLMTGKLERIGER